MIATTHHALLQKNVERKRSKKTVRKICSDGQNGVCQKERFWLQCNIIKTEIVIQKLTST